MQNRYTYRGDKVEVLSGRNVQATVNNKGMLGRDKDKGIFIRTSRYKYHCVWDKVKKQYIPVKKELDDAWAKANEEMTILIKKYAKEGLKPYGKMFKTCN